MTKLSDFVGEYLPQTPTLSTFDNTNLQKLVIHGGVDKLLYIISADYVNHEGSPLAAGQLFTIKSNYQVKPTAPRAEVQYILKEI